MPTCFQSALLRNADLSLPLLKRGSINLATATLFTALLNLLQVGFAHGAVKEVSAAGFAVQLDTEIQATPEQVYRVLTEQVGQWWNPAHSYSGNGSNLSIRATAGGCFCEQWDKGSVQHMTVVFAAPGKMLRMTGALGPLQSAGVAGSMSLALASATGNGNASTSTKLQLTYDVGGHISGGFEKIANAVDFVLNEQLTRLKSLIETGQAAPKQPAQ